MSEPTAPSERDPTLDVLRGFAMCGVLLANLFVLYSLRFTQRPWVPATTLRDVMATWFEHVVISGKAQTLLTFLFGFGFAAQLLRAEARGERVLPIYLRRLLALFVIGWLHVLLLSWVDVTWGYAVVGFLLLPFVRASNRTRIIVAAVCIVVPAIIYAFPNARPILHSLVFDKPPPFYIAQYRVAANGTDRLAIMHAHVMLALLWTFGGNSLWYFPWLLGRFLFGYVAGVQRWFVRPGAPLFPRMLVIGGGLAFAGIGVQIAQELGAVPNVLAVHMAADLMREIGLLGQVAMYIAIVVLLMQTRWRAVLIVLAPVGRMPLTTYLMQSLICTSLFYGWGLHWHTPGAAACLALGLAIFSVQIVIAHLWLRWFRFGPAEWLWRTVVYWRAQPMRY